MSFLSLLSSDSFSTPIGKAIKEVTDVNVKEPNWMRMMSICDMVSHNTAKGTGDALAALLQRMEEYCGSDKAGVKHEHGINLTLHCIEATLKNCGLPLARQFPPRLMDLMCSVAKLEASRDIVNSNQAGRMIRDLGLEFRQHKDVPLFHNTYSSMREAGYLFPADSDSSSNKNSSSENDNNNNNSSGSRLDASRRVRERRRRDSESSSSGSEGGNISESEVYIYDENDTDQDIARLQRDANAISSVIAGALADIQINPHLGQEQRQEQLFTQEDAEDDPQKLLQQFSSTVESLQQSMYASGSPDGTSSYEGGSAGEFFMDSIHEEDARHGMVSPAALPAPSKAPEAGEENAIRQDTGGVGAGTGGEGGGGRSRATSRTRQEQHAQRMRTVSYVDVNGNVQDGTYRKFEQVSHSPEGKDGSSGGGGGGRGGNGGGEGGGGGSGGEAEDTNTKLKFELELLPPTDSGVIITNVQEFLNIEKDLKVVLDKVALCKGMLKDSPGIVEDAELAQVIGFLEASRDRVQAILLAGQHGMICDELIKYTMYVLVCIQRALDAEREGLDEFIL